MISNFKNVVLKIKGALPSRKTIEKRLDKLWRDGVKLIQKCRLGSNKCAVPSCHEIATDSHHIIPKGRCKGLRWFLGNGVALCPSHHVFGHYCAHTPPLNDPNWFRREVLLKIYDQAHLDMLERKSYGTFRVSIPDLIILEKALEKDITDECSKYKN